MASNFGELVLILGNTHIPTQATCIPDALDRMLVPGKMQHVISTGHTPASITQGLASAVHAVRGSYDVDPNLVEYTVVNAGSWKIGVVSDVALAATPQLERWQRKLQCDILVLATQKQGEDHVQIKSEGKWCTICPGSITGVPPLATPNNENVVPSFCLLALQDSDHVVCYVYELRGEKVDVSKTEFRRTKPDSTKSDALMSSLMQ